MKPKGRGKSARETFVHMAVRVTRRTHEHFQKFPNPTQEMRRVLDEYVGGLAPRVEEVSHD